MKNKIQPLLKWAGGKHQLLTSILPLVPKDYNCYIEPFVGGASVLMSISPAHAIVNDLNCELINVYLTVRDYPTELINLLKKHSQNHSKEYYYEIRQLDRLVDYETTDVITKAARIIYLNHTCYNGLYRVNRNGYYNTPIGRYKNPQILNEDNIINVHDYFNKNEIRFMSGDYLKTLKLARQGDFVYLDPPYDPISDSASFTMYTSEGFSKDDQIRLRDECNRLNSIGVKFMLSNSDTPFIRDLYNNYNIHVITACRNINSNGEKRKKVNELLITNY